jgi:hypothetical protein
MSGSHISGIAYDSTFGINKLSIDFYSIPKLSKFEADAIMKEIQTDLD